MQTPTSSIGISEVAIGQTLQNKHLRLAVPLNQRSYAWKDEHVKKALDLCLSCKACKSECPANVDMATYRALGSRNGGEVLSANF